MARWLPSDPESYVLELGPGTGAVTTALFKRGLRQERLVAIEHNPKMADVLREPFPRRIITGDAWHLDELLAKPFIRPSPRSARSFPACTLMNFQQAEGRAALAGKIRTVAFSRARALVCNTAIISAGCAPAAHTARARHGGLAHRLGRTCPPARVSVFQK